MKYIDVRTELPPIIILSSTLLIPSFTGASFPQPHNPKLPDFLQLDRWAGQALLWLVTGILTLGLVANIWDAARGRLLLRISSDGFEVNQSSACSELIPWEKIVAVRRVMHGLAFDWKSKNGNRTSKAVALNPRQIKVVREALRPWRHDLASSFWEPSLTGHL